MSKEDVKWIPLGFMLCLSLRFVCVFFQDDVWLLLIKLRRIYLDMIRFLCKAHIVRLI